MPLFYLENINQDTRLAIWKIEEAESFFNNGIPIHREISHPHKRLQHLAGRYLLRYLFPQFPAEQIQIANTRKPFLPNEEFHFSISHCNDYAAAIVSSNHRVGIDVELLTARLDRIKHKFLHPHELNFVNAQPSSIQLQILNVLWSAKEAMFKWYGAGEVDFSEHMRFFPFALDKSGTITSAFLKEKIPQELVTTYRVFAPVTLAYIVSSTD